MTADSFQLKCPALYANNPRDFLAALGLLRLLDELFSDHNVHLAWEGAHPVLSCVEALPVDWSSFLTEALKSLSEEKGSPMTHGKYIKTTASDFRSNITKATDFEKGEHPFARLPTLLYSCYASQLPPDEKSGDIQPTAFSFSNGQGGKLLFVDIKSLISALEPNEIKESLLAERAPISAKSFRWNPVEYRPAAYRGPDPGGNVKGDDTLDHPAFNVLAFFGLTFFPTPPRSDRDTTAGFHYLNRQSAFVWPTWRTGFNCCETQSFILQPPSSLQGHPDFTNLWQSNRFEANKNLYFAPATSFS
jgi:hypothetical protein